MVVECRIVLGLVLVVLVFVVVVGFVGSLVLGGFAWCMGVYGWLSVVGFGCGVGLFGLFVILLHPLWVWLVLLFVSG